MSYINTAQIALHKEDIEKLKEGVAELKVLMEEMGSHFKPQPKAAKAASTEAKDRLSEATNVVAKGDPESELKALTDAALEAE